MAFVPKDWKDAPDDTTPVEAIGIEDLEVRVTDYADDAIAAAVASLAPKNSPAFTGTPTAITPSTADDSGRLATTAHVHAAIVAEAGGGGVTPLSWTAFAYEPNWDDDNVGVHFAGGWAKDDYGVVHLRGYAKRASAGGSWSNDLIATLPSGAKPAKNVDWISVGEDHVGAKVGFWLYINRFDGGIYINEMLNFAAAPSYAGQATVTLDGFTFAVA